MDLRGHDQREILATQSGETLSSTRSRDEKAPSSTPPGRVRVAP